MSEIEIKVPNIGDFKDVEVIEVLVSAGQTIKKNDPLITIESDKSSVEIPSNFDGKIKTLKIKVGDKVSEGDSILILENINEAQKKNEKKENVFYYITTMNENYPHPAMPKDKSCEEGILKGMYKIREFNKFKKTKIQFLGSGTILREMIAGAEILQKEYQIDSEIWSVTSFNELRRDGLEVERYNLLNPEKDPKKSYVEKCLGKTEGPILAASDYMRMNSDQIRPYVNKSFYSLGTDGFGRSDTRKNLRKFFEVDKEHVVTYGLSVLAKEQLIASKYVKEAIKKYKIDTNKPMPTKL